MILHAGHSGHEPPEALHPSGWNEPLRSVPLLSVPAELWERGRAAAERTGRAQQPSWGLWSHNCAGGVPRGTCTGITVLTPQGFINSPIWEHLGSRCPELQFNTHNHSSVVWQTWIKNTKYSRGYIFVCSRGWRLCCA